MPPPPNHEDDATIGDPTGGGPEASLPADLSERLAGRVLHGRYEIGDVIGEGGFGIVFAARHTRTTQSLVVKVLRPEYSSDRTQSQRFLREAQIASRLTHPHTVRIYDFGESREGLLFIAMERLEGSELIDVLRAQGPLEPKRAVRIAIGALKSLAEAHHKGLVHRDLKPANIFLTRAHGEKDFVKLIDFGIAKDHSGEEGADLTRTGGPSARRAT